MYYIFWALFGNDEDGAQGERSGVGGYHDELPSLWLKVCWWFRNPMHNLFFHVLNWTPDRGPAPIWRFGVKDQGFNGYIGFRQRFNHPDCVFGIAVRYSTKG